MWVLLVLSVVLEVVLVVLLVAFFCAVSAVASPRLYYYQEGDQQDHQNHMQDYPTHTGFNWVLQPPTFQWAHVRSHLAAPSATGAKQPVNLNSNTIFSQCLRICPIRHSATLPERSVDFPCKKLMEGKDSLNFHSNKF